MEKAVCILLHHATGRNVLLSGIAFLLMAAVILPAAVRDLLHQSDGALPLDLLFWYSPETAFQYMQSYGQEGRKLYRFILLVADLVFPIVYATFFSLSLGCFLKKKEAAIHWLVLLPWLACLLDFFENGCLVVMLGAWPERYYWLAWLAGAATFLKWTTVGAVVSLMVFFLFKWLISEG